MEGLDMSRFRGRVAVVTGAAGGLGSAIAEDLALSGMRVVAVDVAEAALQALAVRLADAAAGAGGAVHPMQADITKEADLDRVFKWVDENLGGIAAIVNNAGIAPIKPFLDSDMTTMAATMNTNVVGLAAATKRAISSMQKHGIDDGHVVNIGSTVGHAESVSREILAMFPMSMYIASKHAVIGFNRALRAELRNQGVNVRVTDLSPGTVQTPLVPQQQLEKLEYRVVQPGDLSRAVRFVLSSPPSVEIVHLTLQPAGEVW
ncbi:farnesol dehydrogenase-like [Thrips palmi]|uniref:Farnesol dehydrogenase-like n=1 Tax=Thrips palmi TaxID=161013 RepID=A0A6P8YG32_THRPL|nr:farnesol dehydrogenase-like [Thrips palmi]